MFRYHNITYLITDISLKLSLGFIFFNYGYGKLNKLLNQEAGQTGSNFKEGRVQRAQAVVEIRVAVCMAASRLCVHLESQ